MVTEERREEEEESGEEEEEENREELPDCLMLMMYEPKLSMEVSRETWVCSNDFQLHDHRHYHIGHSSKHGGNRTSKQKAEVDRAGDGSVKVAKAGDGRCVGGQEVTQSIESSTQHPPPLAPVPPLPSAVEQKLLSGVAASLVPEYDRGICAHKVQV